MARIQVTDEVVFPRDLVYETYRDNLKELIPYLPDIEDIEVQKYERVDDNTVEIVNVWKAKEKNIPKVAQKFIKPEMLQWTDYATWHDDTNTCDWRMEVGFLSEAIETSGTNHYIENDDGTTEVVIEGDLKVNAKKIPGVPRLLAGKVGDAVEKFVVKMITPNLTDVNRGIEDYLEDQQEG